jgi:hypothetical protein
MRMMNTTSTTTPSRRQRAFAIATLTTDDQITHSHEHYPDAHHRHDH